MSQKNKPQSTSLKTYAHLLSLGLHMYTLPVQSLENVLYKTKETFSKRARSIKHQEMSCICYFTLLTVELEILNIRNDTFNKILELEKITRLMKTIG